MDESVVIGNITRVVENLCHDELQLLNRGVGHLLGDPEIETSANPFAPGAIVAAFAESLQTVKAEHRVKYTILKELNQASLAEINSIYSDLNKHLQNLHVMPAGARKVSPVRRGGGARARDHAAGTHAEGDEGRVVVGGNRLDGAVPQALRRSAGAAADATRRPDAARDGGASRTHDGRRQPGVPRNLGRIGRKVHPEGSARADAVGYVPGAPIIATPMLGEGLARLQAANRTSTSAPAHTSSSPGSRRAGTTCCATSRSPRSARR
jgi:hypothetical protein